MPWKRKSKVIPVPLPACLAAMTCAACRSHVHRLPNCRPRLERKPFLVEHGSPVSQSAMRVALFRFCYIPLVPQVLAGNARQFRNKCCELLFTEPLDSIKAEIVRPPSSLACQLIMPLAIHPLYISTQCVVTRCHT